MTTSAANRLGVPRTLRYADGSIARVRVAHAGVGRVRVEANLDGPDAEIDVGVTLDVESAPDPDGALRVRRVAARSPYFHCRMRVPEYVLESDEFLEFSQAVVRRGGCWERFAGGVLHVHLPLAGEGLGNDLIERLCWGPHRLARSFRATGTAGVAELTEEAKDG